MIERHFRDRISINQEKPTRATYNDSDIQKDYGGCRKKSSVVAVHRTYLKELDL